MGTHIATENGGSTVSIAHGQGSALMPSQMQSPPSPASVPHGSTHDASMAISNAHRLFCKESKVIFMNLSKQNADHFNTLWFWLMH
ncbi:hypothetical protein ACLB2K_030328 [Fragaria x ananassa]